MNNKWNVSLLLLISFLVLVGLTLWLSCKENSGLSNFGLNFFTEMLGVAITVLLVEKIVRRIETAKEEREKLPQRLMFYEDVRLIMSRFLVFWQRAYEESVPDNLPPNIEAFFSVDNFQKIFYNLNLNYEAPVFPEADWGTYCEQNAQDWLNLGRQLFEKSSSGTNPSIALDVKHLIDSPMIKTMASINLLRKMDKVKSWKRPQILHTHCVAPNVEIVDNTLRLIHFCRNEFSYLSKAAPEISIKEVAIYFINSERKMPPPAMVDEQLLQKELKEFRNK